MEYRIVLRKDSNGTLLVSFPDFPEAHTFGRTEAEAKARAIDALETVVMAYMKDGRPLPAPRAVKRGRAIELPPSMAASMALYNALRASKLTKYALAKKLGWHQPQVDRLFDVRHQSKLEQLQQAAAALGRKLEIRVA